MTLAAEAGSAPAGSCEPAGWSALVVPGGDRSVVARLRAVARALPDALALVSPGTSLTFAELDARSDALAARIRAQLPGDHPHVLALVEQTAAGVLALLALHKTGRAAVVIDPFLPAERVRAIAARSGASACVTDDPCGPLALALGEQVVLIDVSGTSEASSTTAAPGIAGELPGEDIGPDDPLLVVFTSGSTGEPKGVVLSHAFLLNEAYGASVALGMGPGDRAALTLPMAFGAGASVVYMALLNGCSLHVLDPRAAGIRAMVDVVNDGALTTLHLTPSMLRSLLDALDPDERMPSLRLVTTCGEAVHGRDVQALRPRLGAGATFTNWSGSSETGHVAFNACPAGRAIPDGVIPAGHPAPNRQVRVVRDDGTEAGVGQVGEVVVTSAYLASGYVGQPELTAARFVDEPDGRRRYRMGDLGRFDEHGRLHLLGRMDAALKIRGYLVEPSEVEAALLALPGVREAMVLPVADQTGRNRLVAYVAPARDARVPSPASIRRELRERLPAWMVPASIELVPELPRNERGKVDRQALPAPAGRPAPTPPRTAAERLVSEQWAAVLHLDADRVGVHDDFADLGGDSLTTVELVARLFDRTGVELTAADLVDAPTVAGQAARLASGIASLPAHPTAVTLSPPRTPAPLFCFAGAGAPGTVFDPLTRGLGDDRPVYAFHSNGLEQRGLPDWSVAAAARRHLRTLRLLQPHGPYLLAGHSLGGLIALEAARRLSEAGERVELVTIIDTYLPSGVPPGREDAAGSPSDTPPGGPGKRLRSSLTSMRADGWFEWRNRLRAPLAGLVHFRGADRYQVHYEQGLLVSWLARPRPYAGRSLVFLARGNPTSRDTWDALLTGETDIRDIDTDHISILHPPFVAEVAEVLAHAIERTATGSR